MTKNVLPERHLTTVQRAALDALAKGATRDQAAAIASRSRRTVDRWFATDNAFQDAIKIATDATVADAARRLGAMLNEAITSLETVIKQPLNNTERLRAFDRIAAHLVKLRELAELEARVSALEDKLQ